jgi:hypothetical protein
VTADDAYLRDCGRINRRVLHSLSAGIEGGARRASNSRDPLRVIAEVANWQGHSPERLQQMKENVARAKAEGTAIID